ncbi:MAG: hypothetical protein ACR2JQ_07110 [Mycobacteriales bacterium]
MQPDPRLDPRGAELRHEAEEQQGGIAARRLAARNFLTDPIVGMTGPRRAARWAVGLFLGGAAVCGLLCYAVTSDSTTVATQIGIGAALGAARVIPAMIGTRRIARRVGWRRITDRPFHCPAVATVTGELFLLLAMVKINGAGLAQLAPLLVALLAGQLAARGVGVVATRLLLPWWCEPFRAGGRGGRPVGCGVSAPR